MASVRFVLCTVIFAVGVASKQVRLEPPRYTNSWAVEVRGGPKAADELAKKHGFENRGQVRKLVDRTKCNLYNSYYSKCHSVISACALADGNCECIHAHRT